MNIRNALVRHISEPLWDLYERSARLSSLRRLRRFQYYPTVQVRLRQDERLAPILRHAAATSEYYRERFAAVGFRPGSAISANDLHHLPLLTQAEAVRHQEAMTSSRWRREQMTPYGTIDIDGRVAQLACDSRGVEWRHAADMLADEWSGWRLGDPVATVGGRPPITSGLKSRIRARLKDRRVHLDDEAMGAAELERFRTGWEALAPTLLSGPAPALIRLAEDLGADSRSLQPTAVVVNGSRLRDAERAFLAQAFSARVFHRYTCAALGQVASECDTHKRLHVNAENIVVEILRPDDAPCAPGEFGRIVVTDLANYGLPLIRYETGDSGALSLKACPCGRGLPILDFPDSPEPDAAPSA